MSRAMMIIGCDFHTAGGTPYRTTQTNAVEFTGAGPVGF
jgi:hypothetical protein